MGIHRSKNRRTWVVSETTNQSKLRECLVLTAAVIIPPAIPILVKRIIKMTPGSSFSSASVATWVLAAVGDDAGAVTSSDAEVGAGASFPPASHEGVSDMVMIESN